MKFVLAIICLVASLETALYASVAAETSGTYASPPAQTNQSTNNNSRATAVTTNTSPSAEILIEAIFLAISKSPAGHQPEQTLNRVVDLSSLLPGSHACWFTNTASSIGQQNGIQCAARFHYGWDQALGLFENANTIDIIQRPRIITKDGTRAQFYIGQLISYNVVHTCTGYYTVNELGTGSELDVTPHLTPDGSMEININCYSDSLPGAESTQTSGGISISASVTNRVSATLQKGELLMVACAADAPPKHLSTGAKFSRALRSIFLRPPPTPARDDFIILFRASKVSTSSQDDKPQYDWF